MEDRPFTSHIIPQPPVATVKIASDETPDGFIIINESEFDKKTMKKFAEPSATPPAA